MAQVRESVAARAGSDFRPNVWEHFLERLSYVQVDAVSFDSFQVLAEALGRGAKPSSICPPRRTYSAPSAAG